MPREAQHGRSGRREPAAQSLVRLLAALTVGEQTGRRRQPRRMPDDEHALALLSRTGPLAVSSANLSGRPAATTADEAQDMLGTDVEIYLDGGERTSGQSSTIVDLSGDVPRIVRNGPITAEQLREIVPDLRDLDG